MINNGSSEMINATASRSHPSISLPTRPELPPRMHDAPNAELALGHDPAKRLAKRNSDPLPFFAAPRFWNRAQPPQKMSIEGLSHAMAALESASQRLALDSRPSQESRLGSAPGSPALTIAPSILTSLHVAPSFATDKKTQFVAKVSPNDLHALLILLLQVQSTLARTQADVMQTALRQIMAATHARANSIRLEATIAFGVAIGAAALSIGMNVAGAHKSLKGLSMRHTTTKKFGVAEKTWQAAEMGAIKQPADTPTITATKATSLAQQKATYRTAMEERDLAFTKADRLQVKGNAMVQGARIASELMGAFGSLSSGLQRISQAYADNNKTMAELLNQQVRTEADQRRQATTEVLNLVRSMLALDQRGWTDVRIA